ncbi:hypothetical protein FBQ84_02150 [Ignavibacteria bacterium CHB1]|nr:MAG: hypothetical protein EDM69_02620 [Chlorobiota bacterium]MBV6397961.1 hypothetical protein [Ignavibacteria bacterium]MCC6886408.1 hypothetical protein [Ignavibacteriales bacterium]MCE7952518.1 hypothetical protein [Chlorobi bacterium CHB7]MDL1886632.1 hypothetical protein [Ignavibacteria bacterium CHB1]
MGYIKNENGIKLWDITINGNFSVAGEKRINDSSFSGKVVVTGDFIIVQSGLTKFPSSVSVSGKVIIAENDVKSLVDDCIKVCQHDKNLWFIYNKGGNNFLIRNYFTEEIENYKEND